MWMLFTGKQKAVNTAHIVSAVVRGREDHCQVIFTDILGEEHESEYFKSFGEAEASLSKFVRTVTEEQS